MPNGCNAHDEGLDIQGFSVKVIIGSHNYCNNVGSFTLIARYYVAED